MDELPRELTDEEVQVHQKAYRQKAAIDAIVVERDYQRSLWSTEHDKKHSPAEWMNILAVYQGKLAGEVPWYRGTTNVEKFKKRLIQIAAIAAAAYESLSEPE